MKHFKTILLVILLLVSLEVTADEDRKDGNAWQTNPQGIKIAYIIGFWSGRNEEAESWNDALFMAGPKKYDEAYVKFIQRVVKAAAAVRESGSQVTAGQLSEGLDNFYSEYKNRLILIPHAIRIVHYSISGHSVDEIEKYTVYFRKLDSSDSK